MSDSLKFCIVHKEGDEEYPWELKEWVVAPRWFGLRCNWVTVATARSEHDIMSAMKQRSVPTTTRKYYDKHGDEDVGGGW